MAIRCLLLAFVIACGRASSPPVTPTLPTSEPRDPAGWLDDERFYHGTTPPFIVKVPRGAGPSRERIDDKYAFAITYDDSGNDILVVLGWTADHDRDPDPDAMDDYLRRVDTESQLAATQPISDVRLTRATLARGVRWLDATTNMEHELRLAWRAPWFLLLMSEVQAATPHAGELAASAASLGYTEDTSASSGCIGASGSLSANAATNR